MNTHSKKWNITIPNPIDQQYFITLPSTLDSNDVVQLVQSDMISYNLQDLKEEDFTEWKRMKNKELRMRQMQKIRATAGVHKKLKRELRQAHKLSQTESGFPGIHWWHLKYWDGDMGLKIKKVLWFNLMRVEIRELRPKVVTEDEGVLVHYRSRTNM